MTNIVNQSDQTNAVISCFTTANSNGKFIGDVSVLRKTASARNEQSGDQVFLHSVSDPLLAIKTLDIDATKCSGVLDYLSKEKL